MTDQSDRIEQLEIRVAELLRDVDDLSQASAQQSKIIDLLQKRVKLLLEREAEREAQGGAYVMDDTPPPHY